MKDLLKRINDAYPEPIELTRKELAMLEAMLETHRDKLCLSQIQRARRGDREAQRAIEENEKFVTHMRFLCRYNKKLNWAFWRKKKAAPTQTETSSRKTAPPETSTPISEKEVKLTSTEELTLCQYNEAKKHIRKPNPTDAEVYDVAKTMGEEGRLSGGRITVSRTTWASYLSRARKASGQPKNNPRARRAEGGSSSITSYDQI